MLKETTNALRVGGFTKFKLEGPRNEKDFSATIETFKSRGFLFRSLEEQRIKRLDQPSLISSLHGELSSILFTIPGWVFFPEMHPSESDLIKKYADVFRRILATLPSDCLPHIFTHKMAEAKLGDLLEELQLNAYVMLTENSHKFTVWAEDAYCVAEDLADLEHYFIEPASFNRAQDAYIADRVANQSSMITTQVELYFQGGNILIGDDFWFIGADYPTNSLKLGFINPDQGESDAEAISRVYGNLMEHKRKLITVGSRVPVPSQQSRQFLLNGKIWEEILYFGNNLGTVQPLFHIDMFITLLGRDENGKYNILVADPSMAFALLGEEIPEGTMTDVFNDIAKGLESLGFVVTRNPMALVYDDDEIEKVRRWYFASSNNVIIQDYPRTVWMPTYGHGIWNKLSVVDEENGKIFSDFNFDVKLLPDCHPFASNLGAAHCISKYLRRSEEDDPT